MTDRLIFFTQPILEQSRLKIVQAVLVYACSRLPFDEVNALQCNLPKPQRRSVIR
jgi:hypothetical protein